MEVEQLSGVVPTPVVAYNVNRTFNGTSDYVDKTTDIGTAAGLNDSLMTNMRNPGSDYGRYRHRAG